MASPKFNDILLSLVESPRGLIALTLVVGSLIGIICLFVLKPFSSGQKSGGKSRGSASKRSPTKSSKSATTQSSSVSKPKQQNSSKKANKSGSQQEEPAAKRTRAATQADAAKKKSNAPSSNATNKNKSQQSKSNQEGNKSKQAKQVPTSPSKSVKVQANNQRSSQKDDGEWITVAKKRPRRSP